MEIIGRCKAELEEKPGTRIERSGHFDGIGGLPDEDAYQLETDRFVDDAKRLAGTNNEVGE
ncbi:hypothetical protein ACFL0Y_04820 [Patescibacteria group bacterium]